MIISSKNYTADESTLTKSAANQFAVKDLSPKLLNLYFLQFTDAVVTNTFTVGGGSPTTKNILNLPTAAAIVTGKSLFSLTNLSSLTMDWYCDFFNSADATGTYGLSNTHYLAIKKQTTGAEDFKLATSAGVETLSATFTLPAGYVYLRWVWTVADVKFYYSTNGISWTLAATNTTNLPTNDLYLYLNGGGGVPTSAGVNVKWVKVTTVLA